MYPISKKVHRFLIEAYEKAVETFFDDPIEYADGELLKDVLEDLKTIGEELEIDMFSLAMDGDLERLNNQINFGNSEFPEFEDIYDELSEGYDYLDEPNDCLIQNKNNLIEEKLNRLSQSRTLETIGEWATYEIE